jgi:predicted peptidase
MLYAIDKGTYVSAVIIAPQLASGSWNPDKVLEVIEYAKQQYNIDSSRIYMCGMSLGGYGALHFAGKYADKITAAVAICGGGFTKDACKLSTIPLWIQHGDKDKIVPLSESSKMVNAIKKCNPNADCTFTIISGGTHGSVERVFHSNALYQWLFEHVKTTN